MEALTRAKHLQEMETVNGPAMELTPQDHQINLLASDLSHILLYGEPWEVALLLMAIQESAGMAERMRIQEWVEGQRSG